MNILSNRLLLLALALSLLNTCGTANEGFLAPFGSSVSAPASGSYVIPAGPVDVYTTWHFLDEAGEPLNGVEVLFICFNCEIYDSDPAGDVRAEDATLTSVGSKYVVESNAQGSYTVVVRLPSPASLGVEDYEAILSADIGASSEQFKAKVKLE